MKYKLYTTSQKAWDGMFKAMAAATRSIYIEMYIFMDDTQATHNFLQILKDKAKAGLEVVIIADAYGSASLKNKADDELRAAGVEVIFFSHWFRHTHRKILIVDGQTAFIGGVNIEEKTRDWRDMQIRVAGAVVRPILRSFAYAYKMSGGKNENVLHHSHRPLTQKVKSWLADNLTSTSAVYQLSAYYREKVAGAKESIVLVTPYLLPPRWMIALLDNACRRGVRVEILIPNDTDVKPLNKVNYLNACRLSDLGVQFYLLPVMNHAKIMLIDDAEGIIGSQNMDVLSFNWNIEAGVFFQQKGLVADLSRIVGQWKKESVVFAARGRKVKFTDRILIAILKIFYPIL